jgi:site-specific DNA recombinase
LSFAQFEREVIGERIRDKIAASKQKGMWMGGVPPLGYRVQDRKLVIVDSEAEIVRSIFHRYAELGSVRLLKAELEAQGRKSKSWTSASGRLIGGKSFSRGALYLMLRNRTYRGEIVHQGQSHPSEHPPIIDQPLWDEVQLRDRRLVDLEGSVEHVLAADVEQDIAKIMVAGPPRRRHRNRRRR